MKPDFAITHEKNQDGYRLIFVDTSKATYQGYRWKELGDFGKRKFENVLVLTRAKERPKIVYV